MAPRTCRVPGATQPSEVKTGRGDHTRGILGTGWAESRLAPDRRTYHTITWSLHSVVPHSGRCHNWGRGSTADRPARACAGVVCFRPRLFLQGRRLDRRTTSFPCASSRLCLATVSLHSLSRMDRATIVQLYFVHGREKLHSNIIDGGASGTTLGTALLAGTSTIFNQLLYTPLLQEETGV